MTNEQKKLVLELRRLLFLNNYPKIFVVDNATLEAVEHELEEWHISEGREPILACGKNGLLFKGCELVLEVKST